MARLTVTMNSEHEADNVSQALEVQDIRALGSKLKYRSKLFLDPHTAHTRHGMHVKNAVQEEKAERVNCFFTPCSIRKFCSHLLDVSNVFYLFPEF
jgi:hypothetical protein